MIRILIKSKNQNIIYLSVNGHAGYQDYGKDIVCAGVSACTIGACNTLEKYGYLTKKWCQITHKSGRITIEVIKSDERMQVVLETLVTTLEGIAESYSQYVEIKEE